MGKLIVIDGLDGSGKHTQLEYLYSYLEKNVAEIRGRINDAAAKPAISPTTPPPTAGCSPSAASTPQRESTFTYFLNQTIPSRASDTSAAVPREHPKRAEYSSARAASFTSFAETIFTNAPNIASTQRTECRPQNSTIPTAASAVGER